MRTTLSIDDDALEIAKVYADANGRRLGKAISELLRRAVAPPPVFRRAETGFLEYDSGEGIVITSQMVKDFQDEID